MAKITNFLFLFFLWMLVTVFSHTLEALILGLTVSDSNWLITVPVVITVSSVLSSLGQWAVLNIKLRKVLLWIPLTIIGTWLGYFLGFIGRYHIPSLSLETFLSKTTTYIDIVFMYSIVGLIIGTFQWFVISQKINFSFLWIPISILSWALGAKITFTIIGNMPLNYATLTDQIISSIIFGVIFGTSVGTMTGIPITWMLLQRKRV